MVAGDWVASINVLGMVYIPVMQRFRVVYHGISYESLVFFRYTHDPLNECVYQENTSDVWDIPWYTTRERCITVLCQAIESPVGNTINAWMYVNRMNVLTWRCK